jgi:hypothetical protein
VTLVITSVTYRDGLSFALHGVQFRGTSLRIEIRASDVKMQVLSGMAIQLVWQSTNTKCTLHPSGPAITMAAGASVLVCQVRLRSPHYVEATVDIRHGP